jgi:hypothetical protein
MALGLNMKIKIVKRDEETIGYKSNPAIRSEIEIKCTKRRIILLKTKISVVLSLDLELRN